MLTVKHIAQDGTETILEAERVEKVQTGDHFMDGIYLDRDFTDICGAPESPPRAYKHCFRFSQAGMAGSALQHDPILYVMNRFGATVATYRL